MAIDGGVLLTSYTPPAAPADSGVNSMALWTCEQSKCSTAVTACAADACCNAMIIQAFNCLDTSADPTSDVTALNCFETSSGSGNTAAGNLDTCLASAEATCLAPDGGTADGGTTHTDSGATDSGSTDSGATDSGSTDSGATDAGATSEAGANEDSGSDSAAP